MIFWLGIAIAVSSLFVSFALPQKTLRVRLVVLALGLIGLVLTVERYREDARTRQQIEKNISPRNLTSEQMSLIAAKLKALGSWAYDLSLPPMLEPGSSLDTEIISTLKYAGWKLQSVQSDGPITELSALKAIYAIDLPPRLPKA